MFKTNVIEVGELAFFESFPLLVLFNDSAPDGLRDVCIIHEPEEPLKQDILFVGGEVHFDDQVYTIEKVGPIANKNLQELGHVSMYFEIENELLPGAVLLSPSHVPKVEVNTTIKIIP